MKKFMPPINYSRGKNKFDNAPSQRNVLDFNQFEAEILSDISNAKGTTYFCGPLTFGPHDRTEDYPIEDHYRLASHSRVRRFLATDQDGYRDVETFNEVFHNFSLFRGFGYTTWSHTEEKPRTRAVFELDREVSRSEAITLGKAMDRMISRVYGDDAVQSDKSVYQNEQPVYSPGPNSTVYYFHGQPLNVDDIISEYAENSININNLKEVVVCNSSVGQYSKLTENSLNQILRSIDCTDEPTWTSVSNALARAYGEDCRETFRKFSKGGFWGQPYKEYDDKQVNEKFDRSLNELVSRPNGYGVLHLIKLAGMTVEDVEFEDGQQQIRFDTGSVSNSKKDFLLFSFPAIGRNKKPQQVSENLAVVMTAHSITARYNQITKRPELAIPGLQCVKDESDNTSLTIATDLAIKAGMTANRIPELLDAIAAQNPYCPVQKYIDLKPWDGNSRFMQFISQIVCANQTYTSLLWRKWLIQAVGAVYEECGISNAGVIVLTGDQNIGKTTFFRALTSGVPGVFLEGQTLNPADKDSVLTAVSHWIVELGELDATFKKADIAQLKAFVTKTSDTVRRPYARKDSSFPRRTVFAGTVNDFQFLHDITGNRRFWPIAVDAISLDPVLDYQQLWAEVKTWYDSGEKWYLNSYELNTLNQYSEQFMVNDTDIESLLSKYPFIGCTKWKPELMKDICRRLHIDNPTKAQTMKLANAIRKYNGGQKPQNSNQGGRHFVPDLDEINLVATPPKPIQVSRVVPVTLMSPVI